MPPLRTHNSRKRSRHTLPQRHSTVSHPDRATRPSFPHRSRQSQQAKLADVANFFAEQSLALALQNPFRAEAEAKLGIALRGGYAPQTDRNYSYAVRRFLKFAASCGIGEHRALPADPHVVSLWIASGIGRTGVSLARGNLSALAAWHNMNDAPFNPSPQLRIVLKALEVRWPKEKQQTPLRKPVSPAMIRALAKAWSNGSPRQQCALALALAAWCGQMRLGELMPASSADIDLLRLTERTAQIRGRVGVSPAS